ncbi:MAG: hypothetical protein E6K80_06825 [Candidatus Eisenbacteria bacterium]|uniref:Glucose/Sorbosone dehydrogenase domain-containing protein n=1 Tax=Eiseniibacteriota bacterium TaxID=2212470 RepID=A0A538U537_UNCEI|nr:MAG: hypothetical protein E6K80_06825 [Candidatus Eisenbacteria bacterium]
MSRRAILAALVAACLTARPGVAQVLLPPNFVDDTILGGLDQPNAMAFLPDGRLFVTELKTGRIRLVVNGHVGSTDPAITVDSLTNDNIERGLQGIAIDPRWPTYPYVYTCYTHVGSRMVLVRYTATGDVSNPSGGNIVLGSKRTLIHDFVDNADNHNGLGLRFGTDGTLLMTTGDDADGCTAQVLGSLGGKLLRMDVTRIPAGGGGPVPRALLIPTSGNPFVGPDSNACLVYAQGLRNPWRFGVDAMTGAILLGDVGENTYEELDEIFAGHNYGWPYREGPMVRTYPGCTDPGNTYDPPLISMDRNTGYTAVIGAAVYRPVMNGIANWPTLYSGNYFYGDYFMSRLRRLVKTGGVWGPATAVPGQPNAQDWATGLKFVVDFGVGKDGSLWWLKSYDDNMTSVTGAIHRIRYTGTTDVPLASLGAKTLRVAPNPFQDQVDLEWRLTTTGPVLIEVFDMRGRRVRRFEAEASAGRVVWDGRDDAGRPVGTGVYLARMRHANDPEQIARVLRLR